MNEREVVSPDGSVGTDARPRAMIHKKVLDVAGGNSDASFERIAEEVSGASPSFVERVLEEFGDPAGGNRPDGVDGARTDDQSSNDTKTTDSTANEQPTTPSEASEATAGNEASESDQPPEAADAEPPEAADAEPPEAAGAEPPEATDAEPPRSTDGGGDATGGSTDSPVLPDVTDAQRETLAVIHDQPTASQKEVGAVLGVSRATVSKRVNALPGFDWRDRRSFVEDLFGPVDGGESGGNDETVSAAEVAGDPEPNATGAGADESTPDASDEAASDAAQPALADLARRVDALETRDEQGSATDGGASDIETLHTILRVCVASDEVDESQEEWLLGELLGGRE